MIIPPRRLQHPQHPRTDAGRGPEAGRPVASVPAVEPVAAIASVASIATAVIAIAVTFGPAHHGGWLLLVLFDPDRQITQHILVEPLEPLDFIDRGRRSIDVHQSEMRLAVFAQPIGQGFHAPGFGLGHRPAQSFDHTLQMRRQFFHLLRAGVLARKVDVLIERH